MYVGIKISAIFLLIFAILVSISRYRRRKIQRIAQHKQPQPWRGRPAPLLASPAAADDAIAAATDRTSQRQSSVTDPAFTRAASLSAKNSYCA